MPLPKGINTPEVRAVWLAERKTKLAEFDRLTGKGMSDTKAARMLGMAPGGIAAMRQSVEMLEGGRMVGRGHGASIDLGLALLSCLRRPGEALTCRDIAAWCDCAPAAIQSIERRALAKLRQRIGKSVRDPALAQEIERLLASAA